jgi:hypothetical protein
MDRTRRCSEAFPISDSFRWISEVSYNQDSQSRGLEQTAESVIADCSNHNIPL